ncbi:MAG: fibrobacter succinogenes major paralogous domain-containing protein [Balneolales bacterium]|nr:fibrobacter succinogenes major paralogous domain-containing protein [Balneolales bacterium]
MEPEDDLFSVTDIDGNTYKVIVIGGNDWMAENLRTTRYNNGDVVPTGLTDREWQDSYAVGAYSIYPHVEVEGVESDEEMMEAYGLLYNYFATSDSRGLCPQGWRIPTLPDWQAMFAAMEMRGLSSDRNDPNAVANGLKSKYQIGNPAGSPYDTEQHPRWNAHEIHNGLDSFHFGGLPGGYRFGSGFFSGLGEMTSWWIMGMPAQPNPNSAGSISLYYEVGEVIPGQTTARNGFSVRCVRAD